MKRVLSIVLVATLMVGCAKNTVVDLYQEAITFGNASVESSTRADYSSGRDVEAFEVYGTATYPTGHTVQVFNATRVSRPATTRSAEGSAWSYDAIQYWAPNSSYRFAAVVDGRVEATDGLPKKIGFTVRDGEDNKDLLFATTGAQTNAVGDPISCESVSFDFEHLLAKMQFTVVNQNPTVGDRDSNGYDDHYAYEVTDITVEGFAQEGLFTVEERVEGGRKSYGSWQQSGTSTTSLTFGTTELVMGGGGSQAKRARECRQFLPVEQELEVTVTCDVYLNGTLITSGQQYTETILSRSFKVGRFYNVTASIVGSDMELSVGTIEGWNSVGGVSGLGGVIIER